MRWVSKWYKQLLYKQVNQRWSLWQWVGGQKDYEDQPPVLSSMSNVDFETWYPVKLFIQLVLFRRMNQFWKKSYLVHSWSILVTLKIKEMWKWIQKIEDSESFEIHKMPHAGQFAELVCVKWWEKNPKELNVNEEYHVRCILFLKHHWCHVRGFLQNFEKLQKWSQFNLVIRFELQIQGRKKKLYQWQYIFESLWLEIIM